MLTVVRGNGFKRYNWIILPLLSFIIPKLKTHFERNIQ